MPISWHSRSLRRELPGWLLLPLAAVVAFNVWTTYSNARQTADLVTDRLLVAAARVIAENVRESDGVIEAPIPPAALEMFASEDRDRMFYRVNGPSGNLITGHPDMPTPPQRPSQRRPIYYQGSFRGEPIRAVALAQFVVSKGGDGGEAVVMLSQTLRSHDRFERELWLWTLRDQVMLVAIAAILALFGLQYGLQPLLQLRDTVRRRTLDSLEPLDARNVQHELKPLVSALNEALAQVRRQVAAQRRFVANAAHQLRTPLTSLKAQIGVGLRASEGGGSQEALKGMNTTVEGMKRLSNQLLSLARAEQGSALLHRETLDFSALCREALESLALIAVERSIDLGFEAPLGPLQIHGHATLLREMAVNLVENAVRYTPEGGTVTVRLATEEGKVILCVEDDGPGIPEAEREKVFEAFYRRLDTGVEGSGLGLAVVREIVVSHEGSVELQGRAAGPGVAAIVRLPALPAS